jgi:hypothetical protein
MEFWSAGVTERSNSGGIEFGMDTLPPDAPELRGWHRFHQPLPPRRKALALRFPGTEEDSGAGGFYFS